MGKLSDYFSQLTYLQSIFIIVLPILLIGGSVYGGYTLSKGLAEVKCLGCLGLSPLTHVEFQFKTANGEPHPEFVLTQLKNGPVFIDYSTDACPSCDAMRPKVNELKEDFKDKIHFEPEINLQHTSKASDQYRSYYIYDVQKREAVPMFVVITLGYEDGTVKPIFATAYGYLGEESPEAGKIVLRDLFDDALKLYEQNKAGYDG